MSCFFHLQLELNFIKYPTISCFVMSNHHALVARSMEKLVLDYAMDRVIRAYLLNDPLATHVDEWESVAAELLQCIDDSVRVCWDLLCLTQETDLPCR